MLSEEVAVAEVARVEIKLEVIDEDLEVIAINSSSTAQPSDPILVAAAEIRPRPDQVAVAQLKVRSVRARLSRPFLTDP